MIEDIARIDSSAVPERPVGRQCRHFSRAIRAGLRLNLTGKNLMHRGTESETKASWFSRARSRQPDLEVLTAPLPPFDRARQQA
jgi:hypothetical protein